ncbi:glycoside hydrolase, partial [Ramicandelaber brevisporus]
MRLLSLLSAAGALAAVLQAPAVLAAAAKPIVVGYAPNWLFPNITSSVYSSVTHIQLAFLLPKDGGALAFDNEERIPDIVGKAHGNGQKVTVSVGGWTGSKFFSALVGSPASRAALVKGIAGFVAKHSLDGADIDWEH